MIIMIYVDGTLLVKTRSSMDRFKKNIHTRFRIKDLGTLTKHLKVWYKRGQGNNVLHLELSMHDFQNQLNEYFEAHLQKPVKSSETPGYPGKVIPTPDRTKEPVDFSGFRSFIGRALFYIRKSCTRVY